MIDEAKVGDSVDIGKVQPVKSPPALSACLLFGVNAFQACVCGEGVQLAFPGSNRFCSARYLRN